MRKILSVFLSFTLVFLSVTMVFSDTQVSASESEQKIMVMWADYYNTFEEMYQEADIVVIGRVMNQDTFLSENTVHTNNTIQIFSILKGTETTENIELVQLGGTYQNHFTPEPEELSILEVGQLYVLFLKNNTYNYYVMGAGQGIFNYKGNEIETVLNSCAVEFSLKQTNKIMTRTMETPFNGFRWNKNSVSYKIDDNNRPTDANMAAFRKGLNLWNGYANINVYETTDSYRDISITFLKTTLSGAAGYADTIEKTISIYIKNFSHTALNWQKLGCHEMGHMLGLAHNPTGNESAMTYGLDNQSSIPEYVDILALKALYP